MDDRQMYPSRLQRTLAGLSRRARLGMHQAFLTQCQPTATSTILDVGPLVAAAEPPEANILERCYPYPSQLTLLGLHAGTPLLARYPGITYVQYQAPGAFPFQDRAFDIAYCHAVLEHVGDHAARLHLLRELARVSRQVWVTTPNRWYPVELHTLLPLLHWLPRPWHRAVLRQVGHTFYADPANLHLLSRHDLTVLCAEAGPRWQVTAYRFGGGVSNWICTRP